MIASIGSLARKRVKRADVCECCYNFEVFLTILIIWKLLMYMFLYSM